MRAVQWVSKVRVLVTRPYRWRIGPGSGSAARTGLGDTPGAVNYLAKKIATLRIFADEAGKMDCSLMDIGGASIDLALLRRGQHFLVIFRQVVAHQRGEEPWKILLRHHLRQLFRFLWQTNFACGFQRSNIRKRLQLGPCDLHLTKENIRTDFADAFALHEQLFLALRIAPRGFAQLAQIAAVALQH
jgi:hypothetical protein